MANCNGTLSHAWLRESQVKVRDFHPSDAPIIAQWYKPGESPIDFTAPEIICALVAVDENDIPICVLGAREQGTGRQKGRWIRFGTFSKFFLMMQCVSDSLRAYISRRRAEGAKP